MADYSRDYDYEPLPPLPNRPPVEEKPRIDRTVRSGEYKDYAVEYDELDRTYPYVRSGEPKTANLRPVLSEINRWRVDKKSTEREVVEEIINDPQYRTGRKPVLYKRTVTYGPWVKVRGQG